MISSHTIDEVKNCLIKLYKPTEIYLFGSYAWGNPDEESDLDLLVVVEEQPANRHQLLVAGHRALIDVDAPTDIVIYTKDEFEKLANDITTLGYKIKHKGKRIYAKA